MLSGQTSVSPLTSAQRLDPVLCAIHPDHETPTDRILRDCTTGRLPALHGYLVCDVYLLCGKWWSFQLCLVCIPAMGTGAVYLLPGREKCV